MKKIKELLLPIYLILNILYILIGSYLFSIKKTIDIKKFSRGYITFLILNILIIIAIFIIKKIKKEKFKIRIYDLLLLFLILFGIISTAYAVSYKIALYGEYGRYEGLYTICYYYTLVYLSSYVSKKYKKLIIYSILMSGLVQVIYGFFQIAVIGKNIVRMRTLKYIWATGFLTNPNLFGTYMLLCLSYSIGLYLEEKNTIYKIMQLFLIFAFMVGLLISNTLSCFVGLFVVLVLVLIYVIKNKKLKKLIIILSVFLLATVGMDKLRLTRIFDDIKQTTKEVKKMTKGEVKGEFGTNRMYIWTNSLKIAPKYLIHGAGVDNFAHAFNGHALTDNLFLYDKAHNEYLQILICEGIFCLITYLLLYGIIVIKGLIISYKDKSVLLILPIIGYLAQAFFNISVIEVAPLFYIGLGLCIDRNNTTRGD